MKKTKIDFLFKNSSYFHILGFLTVSFFIVFSLLTFFTVLHKVSAQSGDYELLGTAYSSDIGWISFNCLTDGSCDTSDYRVSVEENGEDLNLVGHAWSDQVGWIQFGDLYDFPESPGTEPVNARFNSAVDGLEGWARVCLGTADEECGTMEDHPSGFDGWISLSGETDEEPPEPYGVTYANSEFHGNAWGGAALNWISFSGDTGDGGSYGVTLSGFKYSINHPYDSSENAFVINPGSQRSTTIELELVFGETQNVELSASSVPDGIVVSFDPEECSPDCSPTISVSADLEADQGIHSFTINGTGGEESIFYINIVESGASVNLSASPTIVEVDEEETRIEWNVSGAERCETSGDWTPWVDDNPVELENGNSNTWQFYGPFDEIRSYEFILECLDDENNPAADSVTVNVLAEDEFHTVTCEIDSDNSSLFVGHEVVWEATATPKGGGDAPEEGYEYQWFGDLGSAGDPGDVSDFTTSYSTIGNKNVWVRVNNPENPPVVVEADCDPIRIGVDPGFIIF